MKKAIVPLGIIILFIFGVFMYINRFTIFHISDVDGHAFNTNNIAANLSVGLTEEAEKITYEKLKVNDTIYQSGKKYYVGEENKKNINIDYPIISEDKANIYVLNDNGKYVDENFTKENTYKNTVLSDGYLYNGINLTRASDSKYYFLELNNGIFVNLVEINVKRAGGNNIIPANSFIYFEQSFLRYYSLENKEYVYHEMPNILDSTKTLVGTDEYNYYDLLIFLEVLSPKEDKIEEVIEEIELEPEKPKYEMKPSTTVPNQGLVGGTTPSGGHVVEEEYVKPVVTLEKRRIGVYSYGGELTIYDPTNRIYKTPTLEYRYKGIVYMRSSFNKGGIIETTGLMPSTVYEVTGYYYYHDEFNNKMKNTFLKTEITTGDISSLETIDMVIDGIEPDITSVKIDKIKFKNPVTDEVLKGLKNGNIVVGKANVGLSSGNIKKLTLGETIDFKTDSIFKSNTLYEGYFEFKDLAGNVMKIKNNTFEFTTKKSPPKASVLVKLSKNFTVADTEIKISNPDKMSVQSYRYYVYDKNGNLLDASKHNGNGVLKEGENNIQIKNLYAEQLYKIMVYADYTDQDGNAIKDYLLNQYEFITFDVDRLGSIPFTVNVLAVSQAGASIKMEYTNYDENNPIYDLISTNIEVRIIDKLDPSDVTVFTYEKNQFMNGGIKVELNPTTGFNIKTDTVYQIDIVPIIVSGDQKYEIETTLTTKEFQTLKDDAQVFIKNGFVANGYIDFDVCILDEDGTIDGEDVTISFKDSNDKLAYTQSIKKRTSCTTPKEGETQADLYTRIMVKNLEAKEYTLSFNVAKYNIGHMDSTLKSNYSLRTELIRAVGTTGNMSLNSLVNMINYETTLRNDDGSIKDSIIGINLFDISNNTRWKSIGDSNTTDLKEIKTESNEVVLRALKGWRQYSYYLPELENKKYILSFDYEYTPGTTGTAQKICLAFSDQSKACDIDITNDLIENEGTRLSYTIQPINESGYTVGKYLSIFINEDSKMTQTTELKLKNVKVEIGTTEASEYTSFGQKDGIDYNTKYAGDFFAEYENIITDKRVINSEPGMELNFNDLEYSYVIRYFKNGVEVPELATTIEYEKVNSLTNKVTTYISEKYILENIDSDETFEARLSVKANLGASYSDEKDEEELENEPSDELETETENGDTENENDPEEDESNDSEDESNTGENNNAEEVRYYDLDIVEFTTEAETRTVSTVEEFKQMHVYGYYLVSADLDFTNEPGYEQTFQGSIDFQGHKLTTSLEKSDGTAASSYVIYRLGGGATIKNLDFHVNLNDQDTRVEYYGLVYENYGLISNINISIDVSVQPYEKKQVFKEVNGEQVFDYEYLEETGHDRFSLLGKHNFGIIENFVINLKKNVYCKKECTVGVRENNGTIKNGYIIGKNIKAGYATGGSEKTTGVIARISTTNSKIENVYSLIDIELSNNIDTTKAYEYSVGNIVASVSSAEISNVIVVDPRIIYQNTPEYNYTTNYRNYDKDPLFYSVDKSMIEDAYYINNYAYNNIYTQEAVLSHLSNESFMSARLNGDYMFNTVEAWNTKTFPHLLWPACMPAQDVINIPATNATGYFKILSIDEVIQDKNNPKFAQKYKDDYFARVTMSIYNPKSMRLGGLSLEGIGSSDSPLEITIDSQPLNNSDKISIVTFYIKEPTKFQTNYQLTDIFLNPAGGTNTVVGTTKSCLNGRIQSEFDCSDMPILKLDLYKYVSSLEEIQTAQSEGHENFRLSNDLDLKDETPYIPNVNGVIDGDGFSINGLNVNNCLIGELSGTLKNININDVKISHSSTNAGYGALICNSTTGAIVDNVHIKNIETTAGGAEPLYISGLVAKTTNTKIRNSSVSNISVVNIAEMRGKNAYGGGLVAYGTNTNITNSFVRNINFELEAYIAGDNYTETVLGVSQFVAAGGIVGQMDSGIIENVYATGTIQTKFGTVGGIAGQTSGYIRSAISKVNIYSGGDKIGGIVGFLNNENTNLISKTLVMGDVLSSSDTALNLDRTSGTQITPNQNFAWDRQSINSVVLADTKMEELLSETELSNPVIYNSKIGLSEHDFAVSVDNYLKKYDESGYNLIPETREIKNQETNQLETVELTNGIIPKILHSTTGKILNNQDAGEDTIIEYVELFSLLNDPIVVYMRTNGTTDKNDDTRVTDPWDGEYVNVSLTLKNTKNREITDIVLEDMEKLGTINKNYYEGSGIIELTFSAKALLNKNYDSYRITTIKYTDDKGKEQAYNTSIKLTIPFYGRIETAADWQKIKPGTYQNFVLVNDIDLSDYQNNTVNYNLSFNKLIGIDQTDATTGRKRAPIISGVELTNLGANTGLIDTIVSEIRNVSFKDISLTANKNASGNYFGVIKFLNGRMQGELNQSTNEYKRMIFENITLNGQTNINYVGIVSLNKSPDIHYIEYNNVYAKGKKYVSGLLAYTYALDKTDIIGNNIYAYGNSSYVGGMVGYEPENTKQRFTFNVTLRGVYIYSNDQYAGGVFGRGSGEYISVYGTDTEMFGVKMNRVYSKNYYSGGVAGRYSSHNNNYNHAYDLNVSGKNYVGGICGYRYHLYYSLAENCNVSGTAYVGGISGYSGYTVYYSTFAGGSVKGNYYVGGISGRINYGGIRYCYVGQKDNMTIIEGTGSNPHSIGGIVGYIDTNHNYIYYNAVSAKISGSYEVGGVVGYHANQNENQSSSKHYVQYNLVQNSTIVSTHATKAFAGGLIGRVQKNLPYNYVRKNLVSATVKTATPNYTGYIIGGSDYSYTTPIKDSDGNKIGELVFNYDEKNGDKFLWSESSGTVTSKADNMKIYENSTLNGIKYKDLASSEKISTNSTKTLTLAQLRKFTTHSGINSNVTRAPADANKSSGLEYFPMPKSEKSTSYPNSISYNLPGEATTIAASENAEMYHILPDFEVYAVDVNKINIEFENSDPMTKLTVNGQTYQLNSSVYTFYYDFKEDFEIKISDSYNEKVVKITAEEVKNGVTILGEYYYYLKDGEVITNNVKEEKNENGNYESEELPDLQTNTSSENELNNEQEQTVDEQKNEENTTSEENISDVLVGYIKNNLTLASIGSKVSSFSESDKETDTIKIIDKATNIYGDEILLEDETIYNIETGKLYNDDNFKNLTLAPTEPLEEYTYANQRVETFYYYTTINGKRVDKQVYVKNGQIEIIATEVDNQKNKILVDNYNDKNYLIYLGNDGKLYSIKDDIVFPEGFKNINIKSISSNAQTKTDLLFVEYNDGSYIVFNYRTGQIIQKQSDDIMSLNDYVKQYLEISFDNITEPTNKRYANAKKLVEKLNNKPISSFYNEGHSGGTLDSTKYSIVYDPATEEYYVYEVPGADDSGIVSLTTSLEKSVDSIIDSDPAMIAYYREDEGTKVNLISAIFIVIGIVLSIIGTVFILGKNLNKNKKNYRTQKEAKA